MTTKHGFELIREQFVPEINSQAQLYRHVKTGADLLSFENDDPAKVFGVSFRTIPTNSTGVAHILEHIVLSGSEKYPVKDPFIELYKGSLTYFLNAMTFEDKTVYPLSSPNLQDFYNLIDVYLDAVFHPLLKHEAFMQEGWHYSLPDLEDELGYKGVVFNEMKGQLSNPDYILAVGIQQTLLPDTTYAYYSGGDPAAIPDLTFEDFLSFYRTHYHPSNARFFFYGDDPMDRRLQIIDDVICSFDRSELDKQILVQPPFTEPRNISMAFPSGENGDQKPIAGLSWLLPENNDPQAALTLSILSHSLMGSPASPLRKALSDSGFGEEVYGSGYDGNLELYEYINQMLFTAGLKGVKPDRVDEIEALILNTLTDLVKEGLDPKTVQASLNSVEFQLREANYGGLPRGIMYLIGILSTWNYDRDPLAPLAFETPLQSIKDELKKGTPVLEMWVQEYLLENPHRVFLKLLPDPEFQQKREEIERKRLDAALHSLDEKGRNELVQATKDLQSSQGTPDKPEDLAKLPVLELNDVSPIVTKIPIDVLDLQGSRVLLHDLPTYGIAYVDLGFDLHVLEASQVPYVPLLGRALIEMGTDREDSVEFAQRIGIETGGIESQLFVSAVREATGAKVFWFLRGKATYSKVVELLSILNDMLIEKRLDQKDRFLQLALEEKARLESALLPGGHRFVNLRLRSGFEEAGWIEEKTSGIEYLIFLRQLISQIKSDWPFVLQRLEEILQTILNLQGCFINLTLPQDQYSTLQPELEGFLDALPSFNPNPKTWSVDPLEKNEGLAIPAQVNYVGKGAQIYNLGYELDGSIHVILGNVQFSYLWDNIRIQGGAYGAFSSFDPLTGGLTLLSYRDPNISKTLDTYDAAGSYLKSLTLNNRELTKAVISTIGRTEPYRLPDAQGFTSMARYLTNITDEYRQRIRERILSTTIKDFNTFGEILTNVADQGRVVILGSPSRLKEVNTEYGDAWLEIQSIL